MKILTVVGARPQFVKCAVMSRLLRPRHHELLVHTGQHYDEGMSEIFFAELDIPSPDVNLGIAGGGHGQMTGRMLEQLEPLMQRERPDWVLVYGDTNSTLAGALAAAKLKLPVAHVEAGLRSDNREMPEEVNRIVVDHLSTLLFCPTANAAKRLASEGITVGVHQVGDVMLDSVRHNLARARQQRTLEQIGANLGLTLTPGGFALATVHRAENVDTPARLAGILAGLSRCPLPVVLALHPRTEGAITRSPQLRPLMTDPIRVVRPLSLHESLILLGEAAVVLTDSGGLQKESLFVGTRCVTLRDETEWPETIAAGANTLAGADAGRIESALSHALAAAPLVAGMGTAAFGDGHAGERIVAALEVPRN